MASKTLLQLQNDALQQTDEVAGSGSTTALQIIQRGINESYAEVAAIRDWDQLKNTATTSSIVGTNLYTPVTSGSTIPRIRRIINVVDQTTPRNLNETDRQRFEYQYPFVDTTNSKNQGAPLLWMVYDYTNSSRDLRVMVYPVPSTVLTLGFTFYEEPLELSAPTDIPRLPDQFHYGLSYLGLAKYFEYQKDPLASYYRQMHEQFKVKILNDEWSDTDEMPEMKPQLRNRAVILGKIGKVYNR